MPQPLTSYAPFRGTVLRLEAYERRSDHLRPRWENIDNGYDLFPEAQPDRVRLLPQRGRARGIEAMVSSRGPGPFAWNASYALARAEELQANDWVPRARDQRHTWRGDLTYSPSPRWQFSAAWQYHTGWPTTDVVYSLASLTNGRRVAVAANGPVYGLRLPVYHRLDLRATRRIQFARSQLRIFLDVFNAYDRVNVIGFDHRVTISGTEVISTRKPRDQLPVLPSIGVDWEF
jgi:outer membrane receptor protein involved in Fe transport